LRRRKKRARRRRAAKKIKAPMAMPTLAPVERPPWDLGAEATRAPVADVTGVNVIVPEGGMEVVVRVVVAGCAVLSDATSTTETAGVCNETGKGLVGIEGGPVEACRGARSLSSFDVTFCIMLNRVL